MISFKIGQYVITKRAITILVLGCFLTGIMIGANIAGEAFSTQVVLLFILPMWLLLFRGIRRGIHKE
jgi:hypothetical protein